MRFLKEQVFKKETAEVKIEFSQVTSSIQAYLISLAAIKTVGAKVNLSEYILKNVISFLSINGKTYDPSFVAEHADLSDSETTDIYLQISKLVMEELILSIKDKKKLEQQQQRTEKKNSVEIAPEATKDGQAKNAQKKKK